MNYLIRDFPDDIKAALQHMAIDRGITLPKIIIKALWTYIKSETKTEPKSEAIPQKIPSKLPKETIDPEFKAAWERLYEVIRGLNLSKWKSMKRVTALEQLKILVDTASIK